MADKCQTCLKALGKTSLKLKCEECKSEFHPNCCKMSKADVECLSAEGLVWRCKPCESQRRRSMRFDLQSVSGNLSLEDIMKGITEMREDHKQFVTDINVAYEKLNDKLEESIELFKKQTEELRAYKEEVEQLKGENYQLKKKNFELEIRMMDSEQYSRRNCIEIQGVPMEPKEDVVEIVKSVGAALDITLDDNMIDNCHRLGKQTTERGPPGIIVKLVRRLDAEEILRKRRIKRTLSTRHMGLKSDTPVYINESLCPAKKVLFARARDVKREKDFKYLWVRSGKIFLRKSDESRVQVIASQADIDKL